METKPKNTRMLLVVTLAAFAAVVLLPWTRWIVASELAAQVTPRSGGEAVLRRFGVESPPYSGDIHGYEAALIRAASRHPNSLPVQMAAAELGRDGHAADEPAVIARLQALTALFPNEPSLYAAILRFEMVKNVHVNRPEEYRLSPQSDMSFYKPSAVRPEDLAAFDRAAAAGEKADPDNAFFPVLRAAGQFAGRQDDAALASIHRAARRPRFDDYAWTDAVDRDVLYKECYGHAGATVRIAQASATSFVHYAQLRSVARVTLFKAMQAERNGDAETGFAIRVDMMRIGSLMRVQSRSVMGSLVGIAVAAIQMGSPGGQAPPKSMSPRNADVVAREHTERFCAYLQSIGHGESVVYVRAETAAASEDRAIVTTGLEKSVGSAGSLGLLLESWTAGMLLAANALILLLFAGVAKGLIRFRLMEGRAPAMALFASLIAAGAICWFNRSLEPLDTLSTILGMVDNGEKSGAGTAVRIVLACLSLAVPALTMLVFGIVSAVHRVPIGAGIARGLNAVALPIACVLVLLFSGVVGETACAEARAQREVNARLQHEGRYYAGLVGKKWPEDASAPPRRKSDPADGSEAHGASR